MTQHMLSKVLFTLSMLLWVTNPPVVRLHTPFLVTYEIRPMGRQRLLHNEYYSMRVPLLS
jgi:hypothetical protein